MAATFPLSSVSPATSAQFKRFGLLGFILVLHLGAFYLLQQGLLHPVTRTLPKEMFVSLIAERVAPQAKAQTTEPKMVPLVKKTVAHPMPRPVATNTPSPQTITETTPEARETAGAAVPAAPTAAAPISAPKTISGVSYLDPPHLVYPPLDLRMGNEGIVKLRVLINEKGRAEKIEVQQSSHSARMDEAAREAVMRALFKPYLEDGKAIPVFAIIPINFTINR